MKKSIIFVVLIILAILILTLCKWNGRTYNFKLRIKESSWSGWTENYVPREVTNEYDVVLGKEYSINSDNFTFLIEKIDKDYIIIKTSQPFSDKEDGIDLSTKKTEFTINPNEEKRLETPTMDFGEIYYLTLIK